MKILIKRGLALVFAAVMVFTSIGTTGLAVESTDTAEMPQWKKVMLILFDAISAMEDSGEDSDIYNDSLKKSGVFGYLYDPKEMCFYTADDPWQRNIGYNSVFDVLAPTTFITFETHRLRFEYEDKDWMIQLWKGQYGLLFYGTEVGVYTKPKDREIMHYDAASDDERLEMSLDFNVKYGNKWVKRFSRPYDEYWWCTGFLAGNKRGEYDDMRIDMRITAKDKTMLKGIKKALKANEISYTSKGLNVYFSF